jgi:hypothetical protein
MLNEKKQGREKDYKETEAILNAMKASHETPELDDNLGFLVDAFSKLTHSRSISQGDTTGINWLAVNEWGKRYNIEGQYFEFFQDTIYAMDNAYLTYRAENIEKQMKAGK